MNTNDTDRDYITIPLNRVWRLALLNGGVDCSHIGLKRLGENVYDLVITEPNLPA